MSPGSLSFGSVHVVALTVRGRMLVSTNETLVIVVVLAGRTKLSSLFLRVEPIT